ncbi:MAG: YraN family protein [bacterium]
MSNELGRKGEDVAASFLENDGWTVVERNYRVRAGEVDIIAEQTFHTPRTRHVLAVVEVKTRRPRRNLHPELSVTLKKRKTIVRVAKAYVRQRGLRNTVVRFDVIAVDWEDDGPARIKHICGAFDAQGRVT